MTFGIDKDVFWLHITICHAEMIVEIFEYQNNLRCVKSGSRFVKALGPTQVRKDLSTGAVVQLWSLAWTTLKMETGMTHKHVQAFFIREARDHGGDEGMACHSCQSIALILDMLHLLQPNDYCDTDG